MDKMGEGHLGENAAGLEQVGNVAMCLFELPLLGFPNACSGVSIQQMVTWPRTKPAVLGAYLSALPPCPSGAMRVRPYLSPSHSSHMW